MSFSPARAVKQTESTRQQIIIGSPMRSNGNAVAKVTYKIDRACNYPNLDVACAFDNPLCIHAAAESGYYCMHNTSVAATRCPIARGGVHRVDVPSRCMLHA